MISRKVRPSTARQPRQGIWARLSAQPALRRRLRILADPERLGRCRPRPPVAGLARARSASGFSGTPGLLASATQVLSFRFGLFVSVFRATRSPRGVRARPARAASGFLHPPADISACAGGAGALFAPPRSNARASGPQRLRNDVKRSGNPGLAASRRAVRLVAGSFDRFATAPAALIRRAFIRGRPGAMTPKIARFLASAAAGNAVPGARRRPCRGQLPRAARGAAAGADLLCREGQSGGRRCWSGWPRSAAASMRPASRRSRPASPPARAPAAISFGNTIKKVSRDPRAHAAGVTHVRLRLRSRSWTSSRAHAPGSRVYCRILVENAGADWPLSRKFGTTVENARAS